MNISRCRAWVPGERKEVQLIRSQAGLLVAGGGKSFLHGEFSVQRVICGVCREETIRRFQQGRSQNWGPILVQVMVHPKP